MRTGEKGALFRSQRLRSKGGAAIICAAVRQLFGRTIVNDSTARRPGAAELGPQMTGTPPNDEAGKLYFGFICKNSQCGLPIIIGEIPPEHLDATGGVEISSDRPEHAIACGHCGRTVVYRHAELQRFRVLEKERKTSKGSNIALTIASLLINECSAASSVPSALTNAPPSQQPSLEHPTGAPRAHWPRRRRTADRPRPGTDAGRGSDTGV
jgi:hypothetical protein